MEGVGQQTGKMFLNHRVVVQAKVIGVGNLLAVTMVISGADPVEQIFAPVDRHRVRLAGSGVDLEEEMYFSLARHFPAAMNHPFPHQDPHQLLDVGGQIGFYHHHPEEDQIVVARVGQEVVESILASEESLFRDERQGEEGTLLPHRKNVEEDCTSKETNDCKNKLDDAETEEDLNTLVKAVHHVLDDDKNLQVN